MNKPQVPDHTNDYDHRISALESDMDTIKSNFEGLTGTLQKSFAKVEEDIQGIRDLIAKVIVHTNERFRSMDDKIQSVDARIQSTRDDLQKSFRDDLRDFRREIKEDVREIKVDVKEDVRNGVIGLRWTFGIIVAIAVAVMKLLP